MADIPTGSDKIDPVDHQTRKLIADAEFAVAVHDRDLIDFARQLLAGRRQRDRFFDPALFSNPAWGILLDLFVATGEGKTVTVLDACLAAPVPQGVALRWLSYLKQEDMVVESVDHAHNRETLIRLSDQTTLAIAAYLGSLPSLGRVTAMHDAQTTPPIQFGPSIAAS